MFTSTFLPDLLTDAHAAQRRALLAHPLWRAVARGHATRAQLRTFALQDAWLVQHSPQLEALLLAHAPDAATRDVLLRKWAPKAAFHGPGSLRHFGAALGLTDADFDHVRPLPGCAALTAHFYYALAHDGFPGLLASVAASESVFIELCAHAGPALQRHHGLTDEQVAFFPLHDALRDGVDGGEAALLADLGRDPRTRDVIRRTVQLTYDCEHLFYDTVFAAPGA